VGVRNQQAKQTDASRAKMTPPDTRKALGDVTHDTTNILPAYDDAIFKTLLTHPDANAVLRDVISSILMTPVDEVIVRNTEMPLSDIGEKRERFDVNCRTSTGELIALEMQSVPMKGDSGLSGHTNIKARCAYNLCDLHATQSGKGVDYADLMRSYQVMFCNYTVFPERTGFVGRYSRRGWHRAYRRHLRRIHRAFQTRTHPQKGRQRYGTFRGLVGVFCKRTQARVQRTHRRVVKNKGGGRHG
jgi:hypothetical protein